MEKTADSTLEELSQAYAQHILGGRPASSPEDDVDVHLDSLYLATHSGASLYSAQAVEDWLVGDDHGLFNPLTGEYLFYDAEFDTEETYGISRIDMDRIASGDIFDGYIPSKDKSIERRIIAQRVVNEPGWGNLETIRVRAIMDAFTSDVRKVAEAIAAQMNADWLDLWAVTVDGLLANIAIPHEGDVLSEEGAQVGRPILQFTKEDGTPYRPEQKMPSRQTLPSDGHRLVAVYPTYAKDEPLAPEVEEWAARETVKAAWRYEVERARQEHVNELDTARAEESR